MERKSLSPTVSVTVGILLACFAYAFAILQVILTFGEGGSATAADRGAFVMSLLSAAAYLLAELWIYPRATRKSLLSLSYFAAFALLSALAFGIISVSDLTYVFDSNADMARPLLLSACFRLCASHAVLLLLRIGHEIARYVKNTIRP
ncbi:MAG: hypothetical protein IJD10_05280 [Clostridia bacterium]|nr:hypothetical protein [Clostridia bacterium]